MTTAPPSFCSTRVRTPAFTVWNTPVRLMSTVSFQESGETTCTGIGA
jgi:hypothetical protein